ncbi:2700_t:CDS:1, partial [Cetraspora pellucida]
ELAKIELSVHKPDECFLISFIEKLIMISNSIKHNLEELMTINAILVKDQDSDNYSDNSENDLIITENTGTFNINF